MDNFIGIMIMLNNYFHDFATSLVVVSTFGMQALINFLEARKSPDTASIVVALYPKMVHMAGSALIFVFFAGIIRAFTFEDYEWNHAVTNGQVEALVVKHVILLILFAYGIALWTKVHKKVKLLRAKKTEIS